jgi:hypothetical protein
MKSTDSNFSLFEQDDKDSYDLMKSGIVGGPSIILKDMLKQEKHF